MGFAHFTSAHVWLYKAPCHSYTLMVLRGGRVSYSALLGPLGTKAIHHTRFLFPFNIDLTDAPAIDGFVLCRQGSLSQALGPLEVLVRQSSVAKI